MRRDLSLDDLQWELGDFVQAVADTDDERARGLFGHAWTLISEYGYGHRDEESIRRELAAEIRTRAPLEASVAD